MEEQRIFNLNSAEASFAAGAGLTYDAPNFMTYTRGNKAVLQLSYFLPPEEPYLCLVTRSY